ncbi:GH25 family lysozyme [Anaerococcus sp.]|uniref:GH25 family lysozyme n=1 Tax=Anaerococcus sp. TaxID=1872515 RepID=UPI0029048C7F|nr:GH25 family lysozyme [Anaerococcus sp.]MDU1829115.1 GH25 family lysozyme [Anaerococcus sp.]MDU1864684.1 GH25 family lysozyme [Anaerococcus sp.]
MASIKMKLTGAGLALAMFLPNFVYASDDVVMYNKKDLDQVFIDNGIDYDKEAVEKRKAEFESNNNYLAPDYEVTDVTESEDIEKNENGDLEITTTTETTIEDVNPAPVYSKTPVYNKVVDISEHQDPNKINYDKFSKDVDGAILRTSITDSKTLNIRTDYALERHYKELNTRGVPLGFYHYSRAINADEARREANYVSKVLKNKKVSLPVYIDIEDHNRQVKASSGKISEAAEAFILAMNRNGYVSGVYSYPWFANTYLTRDVRNKYDFWIADYRSKDFTSYNTSDFDSWQYTSRGKINGYGGYIDISKVYKDYPYIINGKSNKNINQLVDEIIAGKWGTGLDRQKRLTYAGYNYNVIQKAVNLRLKNA